MTSFVLVILLILKNNLLVFNVRKEVCPCLVSIGIWPLYLGGMERCWSSLWYRTVSPGCNPEQRSNDLMGGPLSGPLLIPEGSNQANRLAHIFIAQRAVDTAIGISRLSTEPTDCFANPFGRDVHGRIKLADRIDP
jgi:hypothetical protein